MRRFADVTAYQSAFQPRSNLGAIQTDVGAVVFFGSPSCARRRFCGKLLAERSSAFETANTTTHQFESRPAISVRLADSSKSLIHHYRKTS
jgi:hypothetical protein